VAAIVDAVGIPVISNGNVRCGADVAAALDATGAAAVMSAEGVLDDPHLFDTHANANANATSPSSSTSSLSSLSSPSAALSTGEEYLTYCRRHPGTPVEWIRRHVARMCRVPLR
jgi:tRNA-dihydrouridine synthase 1